MMALGLLLACSGNEQEAPEPPVCEVFALRYGQSTFNQAQLVAGAAEEQVPFAWWAWLVRVPGHLVLVDTGFSDPAVARKWRIEPFTSVPEVLDGLDVSPGDVTDVVLTHAHWDHQGHVAPYVDATLWVQQEELAWARSRVDEENPERGGVRLQDLKVLDEAGARLKTVTGVAQPFDGLVLHEGGKHTPHSQWAEVQCPSRTVVLASDNAYLYENLETPIAIGSTVDAEANLAAIQEMNQVASQPSLVVPGHDPEVYVRFEQVAEGVVEIR